MPQWKVTWSWKVDTAESDEQRRKISWNARGTQDVRAARNKLLRCKSTTRRHEHDRTLTANDSSVTCTTQ